MEVTTTLENYKITLRISKITVKRKSFFTSAYTLSRQKNHKKGKEKEKKIECEREGEREREEENEKEKEKEEKKEERKNGESGIKIFFQVHRPSPNTFPSTVPTLGIAREQHNSHKGGTREKHNSYKR